MTPWRRHSYAKAMQIPPNGWPKHLRHQYHHHQQQQHDHQSHHHNHHHISFTTLLQGHFRADNCTRKSTAKKDSMDISVGSVNLHVFPSMCIIINIIIIMISKSAAFPLMLGGGQCVFTWLEPAEHIPSDPAGYCSRSLLLSYLVKNIQWALLGGTIEWVDITHTVRVLGRHYPRTTLFH